MTSSPRTRENSWIEFTNTLILIRETGKNDIGTGSFFRTTKLGDRLVGSFLSINPDKLTNGLAKVPDLKVTSVEKITPARFIEYEKSPQESLSPAAGKIATVEAGKKSEEQKHLEMAEAGDKWAVYWLWDSYYRGHNGVERDPAKADKWLPELVQNVWVVRFEPIDDFKPSDAGEFLDRIHQYAQTYSGRTEIGMGSFFRTTKNGDKLLGSFLSNYPDQLKTSLAKVPGLKVTSAEKITPEKFIEYEKSEQESL
jgi:hypothetical protein